MANNMIDKDASVKFHKYKIELQALLNNKVEDIDWNKIFELAEKSMILKKSSCNDLTKDDINLIRNCL